MLPKPNNKVPNNVPPSPSPNQLKKVDLGIPCPSGPIYCAPDNGKILFIKSKAPLRTSSATKNSEPINFAKKSPIKIANT